MSFKSIILLFTLFSILISLFSSNYALVVIASRILEGQELGYQEFTTS